MKQEGFESKHPLAYKLLIATGLAATVAAGAFLVPRLVDKFSACMIKNSASVDVPDEGPEIVRNDSGKEQ